MKKTVLNFLDELDHTIASLSDDEIQKRMAAGGVTPEIAKLYAYLESCVVPFNAYDDERLKVSATVSVDSSLSSAA